MKFLFYFEQVLLNESNIALRLRMNFSLPKKSPVILDGYQLLIVRVVSFKLLVSG